MSTALEFTITYSRNWDGGQQEYRTALQAVKTVFPDSPVVEHRVDKYPIRVVVTAEQQSSGEKTKIWSGRQQDLFTKYSAKRTKSVQQIISSLENFKKDF